ncbi:MAG: alpha/beta hydrolase [Burkholderiaceae bacterium]|nr:alpha/beta hydrolase [Burkholderiaceae bacterium]
MFEFPIVFHSQGVPLVGRFLRNTDDLTVRQPTVVVTGSWLTVKEQMPLTYARRLAALGYTAFIFDFAGFGHSQGAPRQAEMPLRKINDIQAAAAFVGTQSFVEADAIGHLAICASAQYALRELAQGADIKSFASVAGWYHDAASVAPFYGETEGVRLRVSRAQEAVERFTTTGEVTTVPAYEDGNDRAGMFFPLDYYARADRGAVPSWKNEMAEMSWLYWLTFDGLSAADRVDKPTLLVHGDGCVFPDHVRQIHSRLKGEKRLVWLEGGQVDFYDQPDLVEAAMAEVGPWFARTLRRSD